jgi:hypothetical protein
MGGALGLFAWAPWDSDTRERELEWLEDYASWSEQADCSSFDAVVGASPSERLRPLARVARERCGADDLKWEIRSVLIESHSASAPTTNEPALARAVEPLVREHVRVHCWREEDWTPLAEDLNAVARDEFWLAGFADPSTGRIHLAHVVCEPLRRFFKTPYAPYLNQQSLDLAQALTTLAHEAEHIRDPAAAEAVVECRAVQRVRDLVLAEGRSRGYAGELAALSWDVSYPLNLPEYRTEQCRDGGPLDEHPESSVWP